MIVTINAVLMILALICLLLATLGIASPRGNLLAAGLFLWALAATVGGISR